MKITILGCGPSVGTPSVGCSCRVCTSPNPKNQRTRTSASVSEGNKILLIDMSPDLRLQAIREGISSIDAVLCTHVHVDHCAGIGELVAFQPRNNNNHLPIYSDFSTICNLFTKVPYMFVPHTPLAPWSRCHYLVPNYLQDYEKHNIAGFSITPILQHHGNIDSRGFIINDVVAYCTDVKAFTSRSWEMLCNAKLELLVLGCLDYIPGKAHAHLDLCLEWIKEIAPAVAVLTHMCHKIEYEEITQQLSAFSGPTKIYAAYDSMELEIDNKH